MRTQLINKETINYEYMDEPAEWDEYEYLCPCEKGKIVETKDDTPGNREHFVWLLCDKCKKRYRLDTSKGIGNWKLEKIEMDKWEEFLEELEKNKYNEHKMYLQAIRSISEIDVEKIDNLEYRNYLKVS